MHIARVRLIAAISGAMGVAAGCETIVRGVAGPDRPAGSSQRSDAAIATYADDDTPIAACASDDCLSVLTFNTKHRDVPLQLQAVARQIASDLPALPDFILLQEVEFDRPSSREHGNTAKELAAMLNCHVRAVARDGGSEGIAILSPHPPQFADHLHLKTRDGLLSGGFPRVSMMVETRVPGVGLVRAVNVHLTQRPSQNDIRRAQLMETLEWMAARQQAVPADYIIIGGDFNSQPDWDDHRVLFDPSACGGTAFLDHNSSTPTSGKIGDPYVRVDYVFIAPGWKAGTAATPTISLIGESVLWREGIATLDGTSRFWPSDHLPLLHVYAVSAAHDS